MVARSLALFALAAVAEIGGAWLVWQGVREHRGLLWVAAGVVALGAYGFVATLQPDANFGRILAAYGGVFVAGSLVWGVVADGFRPDRFDIVGATVCLVGVAIIMYAAEERLSWSAARASSSANKPAGWAVQSRRDRPILLYAATTSAPGSRGTTLGARW